MNISPEMIASKVAQALRHQQEQRLNAVVNRMVGQITGQTGQQNTNIQNQVAQGAQAVQTMFSKPKPKPPNKPKPRPPHHDATYDFDLADLI